MTAAEVTNPTYAVRSKPTRGYTLIELMVVTSIVGVLATLAVFGVRKYIAASKAGEAISMIASIRAAEEQFRDETFAYLGTDAFDADAWHPRLLPDASKVNWGNNAGIGSTNMRRLGVDTPSPVYFTYAVVAGGASDPFPEPPTTKKTFGFPTSAVEPFFIVVARGDLDGDGEYSYALSHSLTTEIYVEREGE